MLSLPSLVLKPLWAAIEVSPLAIDFLEAVGELTGVRPLEPHFPVSDLELVTDILRHAQLAPERVCEIVCRPGEKPMGIVTGSRRAATALIDFMPHHRGRLERLALLAVLLRSHNNAGELERYLEARLPNFSLTLLGLVRQNWTTARAGCLAIRSAYHTVRVRAQTGARS